MTIEAMKERICDIYSNSTWSNKVDRMKDNQVVAIYNRFKEKGYFGKKQSAQRAKQLKLF